VPLFRVENATTSTGGIFLLPYPLVDWFAQAILGAVTEMSNRDNWVGSSSEEIDYAVRESNRMLEDFKLLAFNPFPIGLILPFGGSAAPDGYLLCDGAEYAAAAYPELFSIVGYTYGGAGDNFNVPQLENRVPIGGGDDYALGAAGGESTHVLTTGEMPSHSHTIGATITTLVLEPGEVTALTPIPIIDAFTGNTGGGDAHNNLQPYLAVSYVIYAGRL
jgi:microcystin-dependent protein